MDEQVKQITGGQFSFVLGKVEAVTREEVKEASNKCEETRELKEVIRSGDFSKPLLKAYKVADVKDQLYESDGVVYRGERVVIPPKLRRRIIKFSHKGHQGLSKTKALIR